VTRDLRIVLDDESAKLLHRGPGLWLIYTKWSCNIAEMKNLGSEVTARVFVGRPDGVGVGEDHPKHNEARDLAIADDDVQRWLWMGALCNGWRGSIAFSKVKFSARPSLNLTA